MIAITADSSLQAVLEKLTDVAQVRNSTGQVIGYLTPPDKAQQLLHEVSGGFDLEEAERILASNPPGLPLAEVWKRIKAREAQG